MTCLTRKFDLEFLNPYLKQETALDKLGVLDVRLKTKSGKQIDIEMQMSPQADLAQRAAFYKAKMVIGQIGEGENYDVIQKVILILITDFVCVTEGDPVRYHHRFRHYDEVDGVVFGDIEETHIMELPKLPVEEDGSALWDWLRFIDSRDEEDLAMTSRKSAEFKAAVDALYQASAEPSVRYMAEFREKARRDEYSRMKYATQQSLQQGIEQGLKQGMEQVAKKALESGMAVREIAAITGLDEQTILALKQE